ncbi:MAG TPA: hypothetical protein VMX38_16245 [Verrucomicrobiae bacterium]|nr:hypothetical protein [Verrucomicrobiae bacterium]
MMRTTLQFLLAMFLGISGFGQEKVVWILPAHGEMVEYNAATFAEKLQMPIPAQVAQSPLRVSVNHLGQVLFVPPAALPLSDDDMKVEHKIWLWDGHTAKTLDLGVKRELATAGSNLVVNESAPWVALSEDGTHLFWFANEARRLSRETVDLSTTTTWQAWTTDLTGTGREDLASVKLPECNCSTGSCEETCPYGSLWTPQEGVGQFFLMTLFVAGQTGPTYKATTRYHLENGKWVTDLTSEPLQQVLDASSDGRNVVEAIPDTACCGWANQSDDQTLALIDGKKRTVFDEFSAYNNSDYDVSFSTSNARLSPDLSSVAMTIVSTAKANQPIQLAEEGQANLEESKHIRAALTELPAVEVKSLEETPKRIAFVPHASAVGWISENELLIIEDHLLVIYNLKTGARRKSNIKVDDATRVFLR